MPKEIIVSFFFFSGAADEWFPSIVNQICDRKGIVIVVEKVFVVEKVLWLLNPPNPKNRKMKKICQREKLKH